MPNLSPLDVTVVLDSDQKMNEKSSVYSDFFLQFWDRVEGGLLKIALDFGEITESEDPDIPGTFHAVPGLVRGAWPYWSSCRFPSRGTALS